MSIATESSKNKAGQVSCPFCQSTDNELFSLFGQTLIGSQYYCRHCRTVFEAVRWEDPEQDEKNQEGSGR
jgi:uncharacterized Zn finger protein (UPF0148 family)